MQDKKQTYLRNQLDAYEQKTNITESERRALHKWVKAGYLIPFETDEKLELLIMKQDSSLDELG